MSQFMRKKGTQTVVPFNEAKFKELGWYEMYDPKKKITVQEVQKEAEQDVVERAHERNLMLGDEDKQLSVVNAVRIIPPNTWVTFQGKRQPKLADVEAVVGFKVTSDMVKQALVEVEGSED